MLAPLGLGLRTQADLGGMALERLPHAGAVRYRLLTAWKPLPVTLDPGGAVGRRAEAALPLP